MVRNVRVQREYKYLFSLFAYETFLENPENVRMEQSDRFHHGIRTWKRNRLPRVMEDYCFMLQREYKTAGNTRILRKTSFNPAKK